MAAHLRTPGRQELEQSTAGLAPRVELEVLRGAIDAVHAETRWAEWGTSSRPTWLVKGGRGNLPQVEADQMLATNPNARPVVIDDAGHA